MALAGGAERIDWPVPDARKRRLIAKMGKQVTEIVTEIVTNDVLYREAILCLLIVIVIAIITKR